MYFGTHCPFCEKKLPVPKCHDDIEQYYRAEQEFEFKCSTCSNSLNIGAEDKSEAEDLAKSSFFGWTWLFEQGWSCPTCQLYEYP